MKNDVFIYSKKLGGQCHEYKAVIFQQDMMFHFASFYTLQQLQKFIEKIGVSLIFNEILHPDTENEIICFKTDYLIKTDFDGGFWSLEDVPEGSQPIQALSNGSIVTCYFFKDVQKEEIIFYRPNPNAKEVYKPLPTASHIAYKLENGIF